MAGGGEDYVRDKADEALCILATQSGTLKDRLECACADLRLFGADDIPAGEPSKIWSELYDLLHAIDDEEIGSVRASIRRMHHTKAKRAAELIFELHRALVDRQHEQVSNR